MIGTFGTGYSDVGASCWGYLPVSHGTLTVMLDVNQVNNCFLFSYTLPQWFAYKKPFCQVGRGLQAYCQHEQTAMNKLRWSFTGYSRI